MAFFPQLQELLRSSLSSQFCLDGYVRSTTRHDQYEDMNMDNLPLEKTFVSFCFLPFLLFHAKWPGPALSHQP